MKLSTSHHITKNGFIKRNPAKNVLSQVPPKYRNYFSGKIVYINDNVVAKVNSSNGDLFLGNKWDTATEDQQLDVLYHEIAHVILKKNVKLLTNDILGVYQVGFDTEPKFDNDPFEDLADSVAAYIQPRYKSHLQRNAPNKFRAISIFINKTSVR